MNNIQINGQRRWGPPERWSGPPPGHGTEVFIKNLPEQVFELELYATFSAAGAVYEVRLPVNWDGLNRGYAFVRFTAVREADEAIETFDGYEIRRNRKIKVARSVDNTRLFLSAVPIEKNADDLKHDLSNFVENVKKVYVYPTLENCSLFRGYAFVEFETHRDAAIAKRVLTPDVCYSLFEKKCIAAWANPLPFLDRSLLKSLNVLFMRNIPKDIKGFHLKKAIESLTGGEEIKRVKKMNNFAFLTFKDHKSAERALHQLQSIPFLISDHETQVEWAIPREIVSSSFSTTEKECEALGMTRTGCEGSKMELVGERGRPVVRLARFGDRHANFIPSSQPVLDQQRFMASPDLILSTRRTLEPTTSIRYLDNARMIHEESEVTMVPQNRQQNGNKMGPLNPKRSLLPSLIMPSASNSNSRAMPPNLSSDSTSPCVLPVSRPLESGSIKLADAAVYPDESFHGRSYANFSRCIASTDNMEVCAFVRESCSPESESPSGVASFFGAVPPDVSPHSPLSPSQMRSPSSESPVRSPFFSDESDIFPSNIFEKPFFKAGQHDITDSETHCSRSGR